MTIHQIQNEIIQEFALLDNDAERIMLHLVSLARILPEMPQTYKVDSNLVQGCHSKVWLAAVADIHRIYFHADSDTIISKGLASLLLRVFNGQRREDILNTNLYFFQSNCLERFVGTKRSNGFYAMVGRMRAVARGDGL